MNCYICEMSAKPGGMRYGIRPAVGVCHHCGIGVCVEHGYRAKELGAPLLCKDCAELASLHVNELVEQRVPVLE